MARTCVISQPTFLPWMGWFDLADQADMMVILDDVQFSKQSWQQRNRIRTPAGLEFLTVPVKRNLGQLILDSELASEHSWVPRMLKSIQANYGRAPFFRETFDSFSATMNRAAETGRLVELNCALISWMADRLSVNAPLVRASALGIGGERGEHVAAICEALSADHYLSPAGAEDYLLEDRQAFDRRGISISLHVYQHPEYQQRFDPFVPYASAIDVIFNTGPSAAQIMRSGRRPARPLGVSMGETVKGSPA